MATPGFPLLDLATPIIDELPDSIDDTTRDEMKETILAMINKERTYEDVRKELKEFSSLTSIVDKIYVIMKTEKDQIPSYSSQEENSRSTSHSDKSSKERKKTRPWSDGEDNRLLMGVFLYGLDNWNSIANYVGNGRLRSQCMQRWTRGLDPRISRKQWSREEEETLLKLVEEYKDRSWTRIASHFGNRSDVQCRYKYIQLQRLHRVEPSISSPPSASSPACEPNSPVSIETKKTDSSIKMESSAENSEVPLDASSSSEEISSPIEMEKADMPVPFALPDHINFNVETTESPQIYEPEENTLYTDLQITLGEISSLYTSRALFDSSVW